MTDSGNNIRAIALDAILQILEEGEYSHLIINKTMDKYAYLQSRDKHLLNRLIHGTIEYKLQSDIIIDKYSKVKVVKQKPIVRNVLRMSVYQLMHMDRIPDSAICNEAVNLVKNRGLAGLSGFVNGVLRAIINDKATISFKTDEEIYSIPKWIIGLYNQALGAEKTHILLEHINESNGITLRVNTSKSTIDEVTDKLDKENIEYTVDDSIPGIIYLDSIDSVKKSVVLNNGDVSIQDLSSALVCMLAGIKSGDSVIDVCAAPGGKSIHAADILKGSGQVYAYDLTDYKINLISQNIKKSGFTNITAEIKDATVHDDALNKTADVLLADLPCSGLGVIGGKPDIRYRVTYDDTVELAALQKDILNNIADYVKPGGKLIFSTCTIDNKENIDNFRYFLESHPDYKAVDLSNYKDILPGEDTLSLGYVQLIPGLYKTDGFFISVMQRMI